MTGMVARCLLNRRHRTEPLARAVASVAAVAVIAALMVTGDASALMQPQPAQPASSAVAVGADHSCAIRTGGTVVCWGDNSYGQTDAPSGTFTAVSAGTYHSCAIRTGGTVVCWGDNFYGQTDAPAGTFSDVAAGQGYSCAIRTGGTAVCWGSSIWGLSDAPGGTFGDVAAGRLYSCAITPDRTLACWGNSGWLSDVPSWTFSDVAIGWDHSCGVRSDGTISCWGVNFGGQRDAPGGTFSDVGVGANYACAVTINGAVTCWGDNSYGRAEAPQGTFTAVAVGYSHACGLRTDGAISCWGSNEDGRADAPAGQFGAPTQHTPTSTVTGDTPAEDTATADTPAGAAGGDLDAEPPRPGDPDWKGEITNDTVTSEDGVSVIHIFETVIADPEAADTTAGDRVPGVVRALTAAPRHGGGVAVSWSAPFDDGGSDIVRYEVRYSRPALQNDPVHGDLGQWRTRTYRVTGTSHFYRPQLRRGVTYAVSVTAVNSIGPGRGASADFTTLDVPGVLWPLAATPRRDGGMDVTWSKPPDTGAPPILRYEVQYSRPRLQNHPRYGTRAEWHSRIYRVSATSQSHSYRLRLLPGVAYMVRVRAVNSIGLGRISATGATTLDAPGLAGNLTARPREDRHVEVSWSAPVDDGGSPILRYEIEFRRPALNGHPVHNNRNPWHIRKTIHDASRTSYVYGPLLSEVTYTVSLRALNSVGSGRIATTTVTTLKDCPTANKFSHSNGRVVALRDFATITGHQIQAGDAGGRVSNEQNLSQSGCSWIFPDARVTGDAHVSGNAVVYGNARIYDSAKIYGDARVYGNAEIYHNAHVYERAQVREDAKVYFDSSLYDQARDLQWCPSLW